MLAVLLRVVQNVPNARQTNSFGDVQIIVPYFQEKEKK